MSEGIVVPDQGATTIVLAAWLKQPGDRVAAGEVVAEVMTDKVNTEIPAPSAGVLEVLLAEEGETVTAGQVIARLRPAE